MTSVPHVVLCLYFFSTVKLRQLQLKDAKTKRRTFDHRFKEGVVRD